MLWLHLLDKQERYVLGTKIDISKNEDEYYKRLEYARNLNMIKGYGSNEDSTDEEEYKRLKKELNWKTRQKLFAQGKLK